RRTDRHSSEISCWFPVRKRLGPPFSERPFWEDSQGSGRCSLTAASEYARVATTDERYAGWNILNRWRPRGDFSRMPARPSPPTASQSRPVFQRIHMVRSEGLEPPRCYSLPPQGSASTNSATSAEENQKLPARPADGADVTNRHWGDK